MGRDRVDLPGAPELVTGAGRGIGRAPSGLTGSDERAVTTDDGAVLAVAVAGGGAAGGVSAGGPPAASTVVLSHGWTNDRSIWLPVAQRIVDAGHRVVLYDQRGHGRSTPGDEPLSLERFGDDLACVLDDLDVRDAVLVGHSMGGFTDMSFACRHPGPLGERVRGMLLVSTAAHGLALSPWMAALAARLVDSRTVERMLRRPRGGLVLVRWVFGRKPSPTDMRTTRALFLATPPDVRLGCFKAFGGMDLRECLATIDVPTVVLSGTRDTLTRPHLGRAIAEAMPDARFVSLPDAGHMLPLERSAEVAEAVLSLLSR